MTENSEYTHQLNAYFGVFYPAELIDDVLAIIHTHADFAPLAEDSAEVSIGNVMLFASTNSDNPETVTMGFIAADDMTFGGDDAIEGAFVQLEPSEMDKRETKYIGAVNLITDIYDLLVREFKRKRLPTDKLYQGWNVVSCTWSLDDDTISDPLMIKK